MNKNSNDTRKTYIYLFCGLKSAKKTKIDFSVDSKMISIEGIFNNNLSFINF